VEALNITTALHIPNAAPRGHRSNSTCSWGYRSTREPFQRDRCGRRPDHAVRVLGQHERRRHFAPSGVEQGVNVAIPVTAAQLADTDFVGADATASDAVWVRANDGQTWSAWKSWTVNSWPHLTNSAPVVTAQTGGVLRARRFPPRCCLASATLMATPSRNTSSGTT
jgi:hypothetical protein